MTRAKHIRCSCLRTSTNVNVKPDVRMVLDVAGSHWTAGSMFEYVIYMDGKKLFRKSKVCVDPDCLQKVRVSLKYVCTFADTESE